LLKACRQGQNAGMRLNLTTLALAWFLALPAYGASPAATPKLSEAVRDGYVRDLSESQLKALENDPNLRGLDAYSHFLSADELRDVSQSQAHALFIRVLGNNALYIRIPVFHQRSHEQLQQQLADWAQASAVIVDLRGNRGGLLNAAIEIADEFIDAGELASTVGRSDSANLLFLAKPGGQLVQSRVLVLIDAQSASAAELLAGILRQGRSAPLMGRASTGKSAVQAILPLADGQRLSLTTARYFFADGRSVPASGLKPDIRLSARDMKVTVPNWQSAPERFAQDPVLKRAMVELWP
jgi:C-terminal processing protease CtpA/Prc